MDVPAYFGSRGHPPPQKPWPVPHSPHRHNAGQIHAVLTEHSALVTRPGGCSPPEATWAAGKLMVLWRRVARKRRNPSGQLVVEWLPTHPGAGSRRKSGSGQVVLSIWDSMDPRKSPTCGPRDALVLSLHPPRHEWCCPEPAPLKEQGGKSRVGHRNY